MGDTSIKFEVIPGKNQKSEYVMTCGKHTVRGWCKYSTWCDLWLYLPFILFSYVVNFVSQFRTTQVNIAVCVMCQY